MSWEAGGNHGILTKISFHHEPQTSTEGDGNGDLPGCAVRYRFTFHRAPSLLR